MIEKAKLMDEKAIARAITRISHEIIEKNKEKVERSGHAKIINPHIKNVQDLEKSISQYSTELGTLESECTS